MTLIKGSATQFVNFVDPYDEPSKSLLVGNNDMDNKTEEKRH